VQCVGFKVGHPAEINLRCSGISGICIPNLSQESTCLIPLLYLLSPYPSIVALTLPEISALIRTDSRSQRSSGRTDRRTSTLLKQICAAQDS